MRLFTHLAISHSTPVVVVTLALALTLTALVRISVHLTTLSRSELVALEDESELHRAAWALDVAMRHGHSACIQGESSRVVAESIRGTAETLRRQVAAGPEGDIRRLAGDYLGAAEQLLAGDACQGLLGARLQHRRATLDEHLTNAWISRLQELQSSIAHKEEEARRIAESATWTGIPLAAASFLLAMLVARRMARIVNRPLSRLAELAQQVGRGDFRSSVEVEGPAELQALAAELDGMRKQLQQLEQLKQGFLASVSHELRTPLSKIREALALLEDGAVGTSDPKQMRVIRIARVACEHEIRIVTTLLDLSRLRAGSHVRMREGVSIDRVVQSAVSEEQLEATSRGVTIELDAPEERVTSRMDPVLVERAVANLVRNAVGVSTKGQRVRVERRVVGAGDARRILLRVIDAGPGVPPEIRDKLFEPFVTHPVPKVGRALGVGLGLPLAREVAEAHGGTVRLAESGDAGSVLELELPVHVRKKPAEAKSEAPVGASPSEVSP